MSFAFIIINNIKYIIMHFKNTCILSQYCKHHLQIQDLNSVFTARMQRAQWHSTYRRPHGVTTASPQHAVQRAVQTPCRGVVFEHVQNNIRAWRSMRVHSAHTSRTKHCWRLHSVVRPSYFIFVQQIFMAIFKHCQCWANLYFVDAQFAAIGVNLRPSIEIIITPQRHHL